jgi:hypothetical protein
MANSTKKSVARAPAYTVRLAGEDPAPSPPAPATEAVVAKEEGKMSETKPAAKVEGTGGNGGGDDGSGRFPIARRVPTNSALKYKLAAHEIIGCPLDESLPDAVLGQIVAELDLILGAIASVRQFCEVTDEASTERTMERRYAFFLSDDDGAATHRPPILLENVVASLGAMRQRAWAVRMLERAHQAERAQNEAAR